MLRTHRPTRRLLTWVLLIAGGTLDASSLPAVRAGDIFSDTPAASPVADPARAPATPKRLAVPDEAAVSRSRQEVREIFDKEYRDTTAGGRRNLGRKLLAKARTLTEDVPGRYAVLGDARDLALGSGDAATALEAIGQLGEAYAVDARAMAVDATISLAPKGTADDAAATANGGVRLIATLLADEQYAAAARIGPPVELAAGRSKDAALLAAARAATARARWMMKESVAAEAANDKLRTDPNDAAARAILGRFLCFGRGEWADGLAWLARGADAALAAAARDDAARPQTPAARRALADSWWDLAKREADPPAKTAMQVRAAQWYRAAIDRGLTGLERSLAENRIRETGPAVQNAAVLKLQPVQPAPPSKPAVAGAGNEKLEQKAEQKPEPPKELATIVTPRPPAEVPATAPTAPPRPSVPVAPDAKPTTAAPANPLPPPSAPMPSTAAPAHPVPPAPTHEALGKESARITCTTHESTPLVEQNDPKGWQKVPAALATRGAVVYDRKIGQEAKGLVHFEVTRSGYLLLGCNFGRQGNSGGDWQKTRWMSEDFVRDGWKVIGDTTLGGTLAGGGSQREQIVFWKYVKKGENYSLRCNKYDPPFVILLD